MNAAALADRLAAACGGIRTPALLESAHPLPLSTRELEIASLVSQGWSNRDIAEKLVVSPERWKVTSIAPASSSTSPTEKDWQPQSVAVTGERINVSLPD